MIKIECYLSPACGSEAALRENIGRALELESVSADVSFRRIDGAVARALGLRGSPSVLVNGEDVDPVDMQGFG
jgi:hypothetical protein